MRLNRLPAGVFSAILVFLIVLNGAVTRAQTAAPPASRTLHTVSAPAAGDWPMYGHDPQRTNFNPAENTISSGNVAQLVSRWQMNVGNNGTTTSAAPGVTNGQVYVASSAASPASNFFVFDAVTGAQAWAENIGYRSGCFNVGIGSAPAISGTMIVVGEDNAAANPAYNGISTIDGTKVWTNTMGVGSSAFPWASPLNYGNRTYIGIASRCDSPSVRGEIRELDINTGALIANQYFVPAGQAGGGIWNSPALSPDGNTLFVGTGEDYSCSPCTYTRSMVSLNASTLAILQWNQQGPTASDSDFGTTPVVFHDSQGRILVGAGHKNGMFYAYDVTNITGGPIWSRSGGTSVGLMPAYDPTFGTGGTLFIVNGSITAVDPANGAVRWGPVSIAATHGNIAIANGLLFINGGSSGLQIRSETDGSLLRTLPPANAGSANSGVAVSNGFIYWLSGSYINAWSLPAGAATPTATATPAAPTATRTATPPAPTATRTPSVTSTPTGFYPTATSRPTDTPTPALTVPPTPPPTNTATWTSIPSPTNTPGGPTDTPSSTPPASTPSATATPVGCVSGTWQQETPYPIPIRSAATAAQAGLLYSFGGTSDGSYTDPVAEAYRYDPAGNTWTAIAPLPEARISASAVSDGTYIYILNGAGPGGSFRNSLFRYDPLANAYTTLTAAPVSTEVQAAAYLNGRIYRIGGIVPGICCGDPSVDVYTVSTDSWAPPGTAAAYPGAYYAIGAVAFGGYIYIAGGEGDLGSTTNKTYRYDPASNSWNDAAVADLPVSLSYFGSDVLGGRWIVAGGRSNLVETANVIALDLNNPAVPWANLAALPSARHGLSGAVGSRGYYAVGGSGLQDTLLYTEPPCPTITPTGTATATNVTSATNTPGGPTDTPQPTNTPSGPTDTPQPTGTRPPLTATPPACTIDFSDVHPSDYFYTPVQYLYCHGVVSGYSDGTFRPYNPTTRSQMVKIVILGFNKSIVTPSGTNNSFTDVTRSNPFFSVVETAVADGIVSGYTCGVAPAGPCDAQHRPWFLRYAYVTRGQLSKIDVLAAQWPLYNPVTPTFTDVPPGSVFYTVIETAVCHGVVSGYSDHTFRPYNNATRGQIAKIVYLSITNPPTPCGP